VSVYLSFNVNYLTSKKYANSGNFLLLRLENADKVMQICSDKELCCAACNNARPRNCIRISIGTPDKTTNYFKY